MQAKQCKKMLWLMLNQPDQFEIDDNQQFIFDQGSRVGIEAHQLFPEAKLIETDLSFMDKISQTKQLLNKGISMLEGAFKWDQCFCMVDALIHTEKGWDLIEVKSATGVKPSHTHDVGFQFYVLKQLGIPVNRCFICHINTSYVRSGALDHESLFTMSDITESVNDAIPEIKKNIHDFLPILNADQVEVPIGPHCNTPYECSAINHCWKGIPKKSIFDIAELPIHEKFTHYFQQKLLINEFDPSDFSSFKQRQQVACELEGVDFINRKELVSFLSHFQNPVSYLDFESFQSAIPPFDKISPFEQIPFQFSLHIDYGSSLDHHGFIADTDQIPHPQVLEQLKQRIPSSGSIVVFNKQYESMILKKLKLFSPQSSRFIDDLLKRLIDLEIPFKKNFIYIREMNGKTSIKYVLPALYPTLSYDHLTISSGRSINAMVEKLNNIQTCSDAQEHLSEYGRLDTYAMVLIVNKLKKLTNNQ